MVQGGWLEVGGHEAGAGAVASVAAIQVCAPVTSIKVDHPPALHALSIYHICVGVMTQNDVTVQIRALAASAR